ncbi:MAG: TrkA family potassium uptake protein [Clostridia bacterium]|nr:TrkA family potassium uptake protein [Clostridia bacterium]MBR5388935.1 TrkA family potassium uptake protein [Clostridia bacterium]
MKTKSVLLIGLGRFGKHIAAKLNDLGHEVMAVDNDEDRVNDVMNFVTGAQIGDSTNELFLKTLGVDNYDVCIVTIGGDFQSSLETTCLLKELGAKKVVSRAECDGQAKLLLRNGADEIVYPEKQLASWVSIKYTADHILDYIELDSSCSIFEVSVPKEWIGKSIIQIDIRKKYDVNIIAIKENGKINAAVTPDTVLTEDKTLFVLGEYRAMQKFFNI